MVKKCTKCGRLLPLSEFYKDQRKKDGLCCWCKSCTKAYTAEYRKNNKKKIKERKSERHILKYADDEQKAHYEANRRCYIEKAHKLMNGETIDPACGDDK